MTQALRRMRISALILIIIELVVFGGAIAAYFYDLFGFKTQLIDPTNLNDVIWIIALAAVFMIDTIFVVVSVLHINTIRQRNDLKAATLIGSDVQEAYNFGQLGLVVTDDDGIVLWCNNLFKDRKIDLLDTNILDWQPTLREFADAPSDHTLKIEFNNHYYLVRYLSEAHLYIFKDSTEYEHIFNYSKEQATVLGIFMIDNFADIAGNAEDDNTDVVAKVRTTILDYAKDYGVLLRRFRNDSYFGVCNYASLERMVADSFSVLEKVRLQGKGTDIIPTLSIGIAHDFDDVSKLSEMASNALDIAMSRGGDQAIVSKYGEELKYFGGKTAAVEATSKVKVRSRADSLISLIKDSTNVYIMGHGDMDMDALGSCLGIRAICEHLNKPSRIVYDPKNTETKTRYAFQGAFSKTDLEKLVISPKDAIDKIRDSTLVIVCDVSVPAMVHEPRLLDKSQKTIVIDHHRRGESFIENPVLQYVEPSASSASELVAELIHYSSQNPRIEVKQTYATIMLSGIFLDTTFFKSKTTGMRTFEAAEILKGFGADNSLADDFLKDEYEEYILINSIVSTMKRPYYGVVYCVSDERDIVERAALSKVANQLMQLKGISACFVIGKTAEKEIRISARSDGTVNVQLLSEKMGGGGHFNAAATMFKNQSIANVESILIDTLDNYLNEARSEKSREE